MPCGERASGFRRTDMSEAVKVAIIVAMKREVEPLLKAWRKQGKKIRRGKYGSASSYRCDNVVVLVSLIGAEFAAYAAKMAVDSIKAERIISAGLAGGLRIGMEPGSVIRPAEVIDGSTGEKYATVGHRRQGLLVTMASVSSREEKQRLAAMFDADAVDMEAAAVAKVARMSGTPFLAVKAISDPLEFEMPPMDRFIGRWGKLNLLKLIGYAALRPRTWGALNALRKNSRIASEALAEELKKIVVESSAAAKP